MLRSSGSSPVFSGTRPNVSLGENHVGARAPKTPGLRGGVAQGRSQPGSTAAGLLDGIPDALCNVLIWTGLCAH